MEPISNPVPPKPITMPPTTVDVTVTHSNGLTSQHRYNLPNEASVELICTSKHQEKTVYPLVQIQNYPMFGGQSSFLSSHHHTRPHPNGGAIPFFRCPSSTRFNARRLVEAFSRDSNITIPSGNNKQLGMSMNPPTKEVVMTKAPNPTGVLPRDEDHDVQVVANVSIDSQLGIELGGPSAAQPSDDEMVEVGSTPLMRKRGRVPSMDGTPPLKKKGGPYTCSRCDEVFEISQTLAAHMRAHYLQEETMAQKELRCALRMQRNKIKKETDKSGEEGRDPTIVPDQSSSEGTKEAAVALNVTIERGESSRKT